MKLNRYFNDGTKNNESLIDVYIDLSKVSYIMIWRKVEINVDGQLVVLEGDSKEKFLEDFKKYNESIH